MKPALRARPQGCALDPGSGRCLTPRHNSPTKRLRRECKSEYSLAVDGGARSAKRPPTTEAGTKAYRRFVAAFFWPANA